MISSKIKKLITLFFASSLLLSGCSNTEESPTDSSSIISNPTSAELSPVELEEDFVFDKEAFEKERNQVLLDLTDNQTEYDYYLNKKVDFAYEGYHRTIRDNEFLSRQEDVHKNINGKDVTTNIYYFLGHQERDHPNVGYGLLLYKAIKAKLADPTLENEIYTTSFHFTIIAGVNLVKNSPYYGTMKSMPDAPIDQDGYVRFSYMLLYAAKIGIHVTIIPQLPGYSDYGEEVLPADYFPTFYNEPCSSEHGLASHKISEFLHFTKCEWISYGEKSATDMYHVKTIGVKHYLGDDGIVHDNTMLLTSSNLDGINKSGVPGVRVAQTGIIIENHEYLYLAARNFIKFSANYCGQDEPNNFRVAFREQIAEQRKFIKANGYESIKDEMMIYLGTAQDKVFELYFTPFQEGAYTWTEENPYIKYIDKLAASKEHIRCYMTNPKFKNNYDFFNVFIQRLVNAYKVPRSQYEVDQNDLFVKTILPFPKYFDELVVGKHLGRKIIQTNPYHQKDILLEYEEGGKRHSTVLFTSLNNHMGAYFYQTNTVLVVNENEDNGIRIEKTLKEIYDIHEIDYENL